MPAENPSAPSDERFSDRPIGTISLVTNPIRVDSSVRLPFAIADDITFDRAMADEVAQLKAILAKRAPSFLGEPFEFHEFEGRYADGQSGAWLLNALPQDEWRYFVIRCEDNGVTAIELSRVCQISHAWLDVGTLTLLAAGGYTSNPYAMIGLYAMGSFRTTSTVTSEHLAEIAELFSLMRARVGTLAAPGEYPEIRRALEMLDSLKILLPASPFHVIGLFSIIEMLITHNPKLEDRGDSITHQMKSKIPLLSRRFDRPLPYTEYFGSIAPATVWSGLYAYRSAIAHGGTADFTQGSLKCLKGAQNADSFLRITVQSLLRHTLREPDLYRDIRAC